MNVRAALKVVNCYVKFYQTPSSEMSSNYKFLYELSQILFPLVIFTSRFLWLTWWQDRLTLRTAVYGCDRKFAGIKITVEHKLLFGISFIRASAIQLYFSHLLILWVTWNWLMYLLLMTVTLVERVKNVRLSIYYFHITQIVGQERDPDKHFIPAYLSFRKLYFKKNSSDCPYIRK